MVSLYKRATPSQVRILWAVEGAVLNTADCHSELGAILKPNPGLARSIAKRAAGTLTAQWPDVLAVRSAPSDKVDVTSADRLLLTLGILIFVILGAGVLMVFAAVSL
jgi:hypothetical protein